MLTKILIGYLVVVLIVAAWMTRYSVAASANNSWLLDRWSGKLYSCVLTSCYAVREFR
jgi:hypothetical protein